ncbi:MAG: (2Fe-2S)-binding protein [Rhodanobacter sp.]
MVPVQAQALPTSQESDIVPDKIRDGIDLQINGEHYRHTGDPQMPLLWYLRDILRLTGTKYAGENGENGADLVLFNDKAISAITQTVTAASGKRVVTVEGLAATDGTLSPLQQAFIDEDAIGCGYCTPGWLIAATALLKRTPKPADADIDQLPNVCRCGCQTRVRRAIKRTANGKAGQP